LASRTKSHANLLLIRTILIQTVVTNLRKIRTIKELLEIDIEFLDKNSVFKTDSISESNDNRNFLLFDLKSKFLEIFDHFQISIFDGKARHLEFQALNSKPEGIKKVIELIVNEYGADENNQNAADWNIQKYMTWWFKNDEHEQTYGKPKNSEELYYGIMLDGMDNERINLSLIDYYNIDSNLNKKNWLQQRV